MVILLQIEYSCEKGWIHINQDALGSAAECKKALEKAVKHGLNVVLGMSSFYDILMY